MAVSGFLLIDKPAGLTSHDVVAKVRKALGTKKVGHSGTLDPMATGLLVLGVNQGTKLLTFAVGLDKTYLATIRLGASTITDDAEGELLETCEPLKLAEITDDQIQNAVRNLTGSILQVPSAVSAIKVSGVRAYHRVRSGEQVELKARAVVVSRFEILEISKLDSFIDLRVIVDCSSGTYIRALARDLGNALAVGGHLTSLRRTRVGEFGIEQAFSLEKLQNGLAVKIAMVDACRMLMKVQDISAQDAQDIRQGKQIMGIAESYIGAVNNRGLVGILTQAKKDSLKSLVVFAEEQND